MVCGSVCLAFLRVCKLTDQSSAAHVFAAGLIVSVARLPRNYLVKIKCAVITVKVKILVNSLVFKIRFYFSNNLLHM